MRPLITTRAAFKVVGLQYRGDVHVTEKCSKIWDDFSKRYEEIGELARLPITPLGIHTNIDMEKDICDHTAGIEVEEFGTVPEDMVSLEIPEQEYAVFRCRFSTIMESIMLYKDWWRESGYRRSGGPELLQFDQVYDIGFDPVKSDASLSVYIPIRKERVL